MATATHAATSACTRRDLRSLCHRFRPSNCFFPDRVRVRDAEAVKLDNTRLILDSPPRNPKPYFSRFHAPPGCDPTDVTSVSETKCTSSLYKLINGKQRSTADISPDLDIFIAYPDQEYQQYFSVHSAEDGNISPAKYYLRPPFRDFVFTGNSCNGLLHFQNGAWENLVWNPTTNEFKIFPKTFDPPRVENIYFATGMWCDHGYGYKVMQVVMAGEADDEGDDFHIELYSSKSNSWKKIQCSEFGFMAFSGDCINGVFYCSATRKGDGSHSQILSFDFSSETLSTIPFPSDTTSDTKGSRHKYYLEYKGLLGFLACWPANGRPWKFELWVMKKDRSWTRESVFHSCGVWDPLWFSQNGKLLYFVRFNSEVVVFNRGTGELKHLGIYFFAGDEKKLIPVIKSSVPLDRLVDGDEVREKEEEGDLVQA